VDVVADAATYQPDFTPDTVVCCEVLEHAENAAAIVENAYRMLAPGGLFIMTCAMEPRAPHSAVDGGPLERIESTFQAWHPCMYRPVGGGAAEFYRNVSVLDFQRWAQLSPGVDFLIENIEQDPKAGDLRVLARKPDDSEPDLYAKALGKGGNDG
jgi:SAM-dependent methyltransferase